MPIKYIAGSWLQVTWLWLLWFCPFWVHEGLAFACPTSSEVRPGDLLRPMKWVEVTHVTSRRKHEEPRHFLPPPSDRQVWNRAMAAWVLGRTTPSAYQPLRLGGLLSQQHNLEHSKSYGNYKSWWFYMNEAMSITGVSRSFHLCD